MLELLIDGFEDTFEISPSLVENSAQFVISVKNNKKLDFERRSKIEFEVWKACICLTMMLTLPWG
jgi:hypothetical protein